MKLRIILVLFLFSTAHAQVEIERERLYQTPDPASLTPGQIQGNKEVFLYNESLIVEDKGGYTEASYTGTDNNRFGLGFHLSSNYQDFAEITSLEIMFARQLQSYSEFWINFLFKQTQGTYEAFAEEIESENATTTRKGSDQSFTTLGVGGGYRFKALSKAFGFNRLFETVDAYITYNSHLDGATDTRYQGFGLQSDYGLHYRGGESIVYGAKLSYNIVAVERANEGDEDLIDRSLVFGWLSLGFELGYYY